MVVQLNEMLAEVQTELTDETKVLNDQQAVVDALTAKKNRIISARDDLIPMEL